MVTPISSIVKSRVEEYNNLSRDSVFETVRAVHDTGFENPCVPGSISGLGAIIFNEINVLSKIV
jgi:hypothetical protein